MDPVNIAPNSNILVSHLSAQPSGQVAMTGTSDMPSVMVQTMIYYNTYKSVQLLLNVDDKRSFNLFLCGESMTGDFAADTVTLVNAGGLKSKPGLTKEMVKVCTLQYFSKTENKLEKVETVMPDTLKQLDDVVETNQNFILSEDQVKYFEKLMARIGSKSFLTPCVAAAANPAILPRVKTEQDLGSLQVGRVDFTNIEEMFVKVSLTSRGVGVVIRQEVSTVISETDSPLTSTLVTSEDYCIFVCSLASPMSHSKFILGIPHTDTSKLPRQADLWRNVQLKQLHSSSSSPMCQVIFSNCQQSSFSASVPADFLAVSLLVNTRKPFVISEDNLVSIEQECLHQTSLPFFLSDPLPAHIQILHRSVAVPQVPTSHTILPILSQTQPPPIPQLPNLPPSQPLLPPTPPVKLTPSVPDMDMAPTPAKTMVFHTARPSQSSPLPAPPPAPQSTCPACPATFSLSQPSDVPVFAKHFYLHFPLSSHLIPEFLQRFSSMQEQKQNTPTFCPFIYCSEVSSDVEDISDTQKIGKHLRRKHQFEILCFQISTLCKDFELSPLFLQLMKNCKIENLKMFINSNLEKFKSTKVKSEFRIKSEETSETLEEGVDLPDQHQNVTIESSDIKAVIKPAEKFNDDQTNKDDVKVDDSFVPTSLEPLYKAKASEVKVIKTENKLEVQKSVGDGNDHNNHQVDKKSGNIEIIDKEVVINKNQATATMKQFFRANVKDEDCRFFLKSRGEEMPIGMVDKLVFFLFEVSSSYQESLQLIKFAVKNLKKIVKKDGSQLSVSFIFETDSFLQMKAIHKYIIQYKEFCKLLQMNPKNCNSEILDSLIAKLVKEWQGDLDNFPLFLTWLGRTHQKKGGKSVDQIRGISQLTKTIKVGDNWKNSSTLAEIAFEKDVLKCGKCDQTFEDVISILLHTGTHGEDPVDVTCTKCEDKVETIVLREKKDTLVFRAILDLHLLSKPHLHNVLNEINLPLSQIRCDACNTSFSSPSEIIQHTSTSDHKGNILAVQEYLEFCLARQLDPVNHSVFPSFIFFLRCIQSLSVNLQIPIRQTMDVVSNIHSNFNNLLNVNESSDVKEEVIRKLSCGEPAIFFCFTCNQSFLSINDVEEHFSSDEHEESLQSNGVKTVRCVVCKSFILQDDLQYHDHKIINSMDDDSECNIVEIIDVDEEKIKPPIDTKDNPSGHDDMSNISESVPQCVPAEETKECTDKEESSYDDVGAIKINETTKECENNISQVGDDQVQSTIASPDDQESSAGYNTDNQMDITKTDENGYAYTSDNSDKVHDIQLKSCTKDEAFQEEEEISLEEELIESDLLLEEAVIEEDQTSKVLNAETIAIAIVETSTSSEIMSKCDETINWLLQEQDKTKSLKNSFLNREVVQSSGLESKQVSEVEISEEQGAFGNPDNYMESDTSDLAELIDAISEGELNVNIQEVVERNNVEYMPSDLNYLNDNATYDKKEEDTCKNKDQNNSNIPSWEFVPIRGQNFQFHVLPSVDSIPADPVENIIFDISLKEIMEMHTKKYGLFMRSKILAEECGEKRKSASIDSKSDFYLDQYKKLKMDPKIFLSPCQIPSCVPAISKNDKPGVEMDEQTAVKMDIDSEFERAIDVKDLPLSDINDKSLQEKNTTCLESVEKKQEYVEKNMKSGVDDIYLNHVDDEISLESRTNDNFEKGHDMGEDVSNRRDEEEQVEKYFVEGANCTKKPVKRGRGRPKKNLMKLDNAMEKSEEGQTLEHLSTPETKSTKPESAQNETVPETNEVPTLELEANVEAPLQENANKDDTVALKVKLDTKSLKIGNNGEEIDKIGTDVIVQTIKLSSFKSNQEIDSKSLDTEFEFDSVVSSANADISEEGNEDSSSEYEDSDDELEIIDEIIVDEGSDITLDVSGVKLEPKEAIDKSVERTCKSPGEVDQTLESGQKETKLIQEPLIEKSESIEKVSVFTKVDSSLSSPTLLTDEEEQMKDIELPALENVELSSVCNMSTSSSNQIQNSIKRKLVEMTEPEGNEPLSTPSLPTYQPIKFDVKIVDVAKNCDWKLYVEPQVKYFKRRAAVINRWENDIQAYFEQRN